MMKTADGFRTEVIGRTGGGNRICLSRKRFGRCSSGTKGKRYATRQDLPMEDLFVAGCETQCWTEFGHARSPRARRRASEGVPAGISTPAATQSLTPVVIVKRSTI